MNNALIIFIKNPQWGKAKTRLAKTTGNDQALAIYLRLLNYTREVTKQASADKFLFYSDFICFDDEWNSTIFIKEKQKGNDLGERMANAFQYAFSQGASNVVIIGSDCAELTPAIIENAFSALEESSLVFGPAKDGGYYLLGMNKFHLPIFEQKPWSQANLLDVTLEQVKQIGLSHKLLPELSDVDTEQDWNEVKDKID